MGWFAIKTLGLPRYLWLVIAVAALIAAAAWYKVAQDAHDKHNQELGAKAERSEQLGQTVTAVETANAAREEIAKPGPVGDCIRYRQCLRSARDGSVCARFLPVGEAGHGPTCASAGR